MATRKATPGAAPAKKAPAKKAAAKKAAPAKKAPAKKAPAKKAPPPGPQLQVKQDETPWSPAELGQIQAELEADVERLLAEIAHAEDDLVGLIRDAGDGAGDDQADAGTKTFEREQEITLANNSREMLVQSEHALERIHDGTYGVCESCGNPVGKLRLMAFPRATLCVACKQKQERR